MFAPCCIQVTGDPRRPDEAVPFERKKTEDAGDIMLVVAVVVGAASLLFKVRPETRNTGRAVRLPTWHLPRCRSDERRTHKAIAC